MAASLQSLFLGPSCVFQFNEFDKLLLGNDTRHSCPYRVDTKSRSNDVTLNAISCVIRMIKCGTPIPFSCAEEYTLIILRRPLSNGEKILLRVIILPAFLDSAVTFRTDALYLFRRSLS